ncbi:nuclear transport factor 2 family protein [Prolixibacter denitrificans]|uniref:SnoaL-like protein n=1 Tax=Prolixibacter denitrificans TaxID=1541063 RepID=A0A2P8CF43_9BACT|nr:nuclear transport factor 2 family protein [Prolixibacter denitrificans]PSK83595.1 SnoaL-like protein [Prolixibacter denitrificans]GET23144.1 hypothetical protein JCM18694_33900 [Prolixibacter denitrificans]
MTQDDYRKIIENYVDAYNHFDVDRMLADIDEEARFENISEGEVTLTTEGKAALREQAREAAEVFSEREQVISNFQFHKQEVEVDVDFSATLAIDFSEELKAGDRIAMTGKSVFTFRDDKIIELKDIS